MNSGIPLIVGPGTRIPLFVSFPGPYHGSLYISSCFTLMPCWCVMVPVWDQAMFMAELEARNSSTLMNDEQDKVSSR